MVSLKKVNKKDIPAGSYGTANLQSLIEEFMSSNDVDAAEIIWENDYNSAESCASSWTVAVKRSKRMCKIVRRGNKVWIIKTGE